MARVKWATGKKAMVKRQPVKTATPENGLR